VVQRWYLVLAAALIGLAAQPAAAQAAPGWLGPLDLTDPAGVTFDADIDSDTSGKATGVWLRFSGGASRVTAAIRQPGDLSFGPQQQVTPGSEDASEPHVAVNDNGEAIVVWTRNTDSVIRAAYRAPGASVFGSAVTISATAAFSPRVAIDPSGNSHAIWERQVGSTTVIESASKVGANPFGAVETLSDPAFSSDRAQIAAETQSRAVAIWTRFNAASVIQTSSRIELNYPRPGGGTQFAVPLVPEFNACSPPGNSNHVAPLNLDSCSPPTLASPRLTTSTVGAASGSVRYDVIAGNAGTPEDEADFGISARITDVRCAVGGTPGCAAAGDDYTGQLVLASAVRQTDMSNGIFQNDPGTVVDFDLSFPLGCAVNPLMTVGSTCSLTSTADTLVPGYVKEIKRTILSVMSVRLKDAGADGTITPPSGTCPPTCGNGDEAVYQRSGVFAP
jgi:hypothetical protein